MPKVETPSLLKVYQFLGMDLSGKSGDNQAVGQCPLCGRERKFYVNIENGKWECKICDEHGNLHTFLKRVWEESIQRQQDYIKLGEERGFIFPEMLQDWGLCRSVINDEWILPGYFIDPSSRKPRLRQLYIYRKDSVEKRMRFICKSFKNVDDQYPTSSALFMPRWDPKKPNVAILEGLWDGVAFYEVSRFATPEFDYANTEEESIYAQTNIVATPGANTFYESWTIPMNGKNVSIFYDNDYPRIHPKNGRRILGAGILGSKKVVETLWESPDRPADVKYVNWGEEGHTTDYPNRYDTRDHLKQVPTIEERIPLLKELYSKLVDPPDEWLTGKTKEAKGFTPPPLPCSSWQELKQVWQEAMYWNDGLDHALPAMIACATSVLLPEDQYWLRVVSPASTGKTELAEAIGIAEQHVEIVSVFTGLHSGMRLAGGEDGSLISKLGGRCLIIKEGDTLLRLPNKEQVWSELRDGYDRNTRTHFKNGVAMTYRENSWSHILCGTQALHEMDGSELGQRYLDLVIIDKIEMQTERMINISKGYQMRALFKNSPIMNGKGSTTEEKMKARQMTGGYVIYLHENMGALVSAIDATDDSISLCSDFAQFIAIFRARPSMVQSEEVSRELSARLYGQLCKLAYTLAAVFGKKEIDYDILMRVKKVTLDTARGRTFNIGKLLYEAGTDGRDVSSLAIDLMEGEKETREFLKFLAKIDVVESYRKDGKVGLGSSIRHRLKPEVFDLFRSVMSFQ